MPLTVRPIDVARHLAWIEQCGPVSFLQTPAWGRVKSDWQHQSVGVFDHGELVAAALMLFRPIPLARYTLAYIPEGPALSGLDPTREVAALGAIAEFAATRHAFALTAGPPLWWRRWNCATIKAALASPARSFAEVAPDQSNPQAEALASALTAAGWRPPAAASGFGAGQPEFVFQLPLAGRAEAEVAAGFNQLWRRNIRKSVAAGVRVQLGGRADLAAFHALYAQTAERDRFAPRPLGYFHRLWDAEVAEDPTRVALYLALHETDLVAATIAMRVPGHTWYVYGASSSAKRDVRGSNAVQWQMVKDAIGHGDALYDMRGITDTVDASDRHAGLLQFKVGTGGFAQQYLGEWTYPIRPAVYRAFEMAMARRARRRR